MLRNFKLILVCCIGSILLMDCHQSAVNEQYVKAYITEPQNPLIPANTYDTEGTKIVNLLFSGLFFYDEQGSLINEVAQSVETQDNQHYIVKLNPEFKFSDGSNITARHFVDTWNLAVKQKMLMMSAFSDIQGYPQEGENFTSLNGLKIIDNYTFSIDLKYPVYEFKNKLGFPAFYAIHDLAFKDIKAYGQNPIGNGPYKLSNKDAWVHNKSITLIPNEQYKGPRKAKNQGILFKVYTLLNTAYADLLSGQLDVLEAMPTEQLDKYHNDLSGRFVDRDFASIVYLGVNLNTTHFQLDQEGRLRRQAISMAIDREEINQVIFYNTRIPAQDFTTLSLSKNNLHLEKSDTLCFNPQKAKELWAKADKISKFTDVFSLSYNSDAAHQGWMEAVANQLRNNLNIQVKLDPYPDFKSFLDDKQKSKLKYGFYHGWAADYPNSALNFLEINLSDSLINTPSYKNYRFDELFNQAVRASNRQQYQHDVHNLQEMLLADLPIIPLWYSTTNAGFSKNVTNVKFAWNRFPLYYDIIKQ